jgi:hypothetical protein
MTRMYEYKAIEEQGINAKSIRRKRIEQEKISECGTGRNEIEEKEGE